MEMLSAQQKKVANFFFFFRCVRSRKRENADERRGSKIDNVIDLDDVHVIQSSFFFMLYVGA